MDIQLIKSKAEKWMNSLEVDVQSKEAINKLLISPDDGPLKEAFYQDLEFGTGGLRGIMGVGSNKVNKYTIGMATQGLSNYLLKKFADHSIKVVVAYDNRNNSRELAQVTADVFSANGFQVFLFEELRPTPELSFAIRHLGCHSGVMLTASHNPKEYNGYKAYWIDGAQLIHPHDQAVMDEVAAISSFDQVKFDGNSDYIHPLGAEMDEVYLEMVSKLSLNPEINKKYSDLSIVFTPLHGTGITMVPQALKRFGFENVSIVEEQAIPDGNFPTVIFPNPEEAEALTMAVNLAKEIDAELVMANDPDADRVGIGVKNLSGEFELLNGNQTASLLTYYLLSQWETKLKLSGNEFVVKTIVTTELIKDIADHYRTTCYDTLTGFKYIAALIRKLEGKKKFIGGGEESYGYMIGDAVRDKDAVVVCAMIAEMTAFVKSKGISLYEWMIDMYCQFGLYHEHLISITKKGISGAEEIKQMMADFRANPPQKIAGSRVMMLLDYQSGEAQNLINGDRINMDFPASNVLQFITEDGSKISARPSGTEPKIKFYFSVKTDLENKEDYATKKASLVARIDRIVEDMKL